MLKAGQSVAAFDALLAFEDAPLAMLEEIDGFEVVIKLPQIAVNSQQRARSVPPIRTLKSKLKFRTLTK